MQRLATSLQNSRQLTCAVWLPGRPAHSDSRCWRTVDTKPSVAAGENGSQSASVVCLRWAGPTYIQSSLHARLTEECDYLLLGQEPKIIPEEWMARECFT